MIVLEFDSAAYSIEAAQAAAYRFIDRLTVVISCSEKTLRCEITQIPDRVDDIAACLDEFKRELLDQQLRKRIAAETEPVRNLILSLAFSRTGLQT